jgi:hypothetical protein
MAFRRLILCSLALLAIGWTAVAAWNLVVTTNGDDQAGPTPGNADTAPDTIKLARERLRSIMPTRQKVAAFIKPKPADVVVRGSYGWTYEPELGWRLYDGVRLDGINGSKTFYHYESDGARRVVNSAGKPCRIHTYGNSFTHCDQVNDGETWQEYLAAHFQEPIRNYGVGGYSVYQAYRRMLQVEKAGGSKYLILNIYSYDHYRNLSPWWSISGTPSAHDFTLPHLRVNVQKGRCEQIENPLRKAEDLYRLCDEDFVWRRFKDEPVLLTTLARAGNETLAEKLIDPIAAGFGISKDKITGASAAQRIEKIHTAAALFATKKVITWTEQFVEKRGKKLLIILSFSSAHVRADLQGQPRFDQDLIDWLKHKPYPVIDLRDSFRADYKRFKGDIKTYLARYYIGHHTPAGNFFTAWAVRDRLIKWLEPAPLPYR